MDSRNRIVEGSLVKALFVLGAPTIATGLLQSTFNIVDMIFVGRLGPDALAAVSVSGVVVFFLITIAIGVSIGTLSLVARCWGGRHYRSAALILAQSIYLSFILSALFSVSGWYAAGPLLSLLGARGEVLQMAVNYFRIISLGSGGIFIAVSLAAALRGAGNATIPLKVMGLAVGLNIVLDPIMIFGLLGFPALGVSGSALATVISRGIAVAVLAKIVLSGDRHFNLTGAFSSVRWPLVWDIIKIGFYSSVEMFIRSATSLVFLKIVAPFGTAALAAFGIGTRIRLMLMMPGIGLGYASGVIVGQSLGAKKPQRARRAAWLSVLAYELMLVPIVVVLLLIPRFIIGFFNRDTEVVRIGADFITYIAVSMLFMAVMIVLGKSLNGAGDTKSPMIITGVCLALIGIPLAYFGSMGWGVRGVWIALLISTVLQGIIMIGWFQMGRWVEGAPVAEIPEAIPPP